MPKNIKTYKEGIKDIKATGVSVNDIRDNRKQELEHMRNLVSSVKENTEFLSDVSKNEELIDELVGIDKKFSKYFENLSEMKKLSEEFLNPNTKLNKEQIDRLQQLINKDIDITKSINTLKDENEYVGKTLIKLQEKHGFTLREQGVAEEEQRDWEEKRAYKFDKTFNKIDKGVKELSESDLFEGVGETLLGAFGGQEAILLKQAMGPLLSKFKDSPFFQKTTSKIKRFFFGKALTEESQVLGTQEVPAKVEPETNVDQKIEEQIQTTQKTSDDLKKAIQESIVPSQSEVKKRLNREARVMRNDKGRLVDVVNQKSIKSTAENMDESVQFQKELLLSGKNLNEHIIDLKRKFSEPFDVVVVDDKKREDIEKKSLESDIKQGESIIDLRDDINSKLKDVIEISDENIQLQIAQEKLSQISNNELENILSSHISGNNIINDLVSEEELVNKKLDWQNKSILDRAEDQQVVWEAEDKFRENQEEFNKKALKYLKEIKSTSGEGGGVLSTAVGSALGAGKIGNLLKGALSTLLGSAAAVVAAPVAMAAVGSWGLGKVFTKPGEAGPTEQLINKAKKYGAKNVFRDEIKLKEEVYKKKAAEKYIKSKEADFSEVSVADLVKENPKITPEEIYSQIDVLQRQGKSLKVKGMLPEQFSSKTGVEIQDMIKEDIKSYNEEKNKPIINLEKNQDNLIKEDIKKSGDTGWKATKEGKLDKNLKGVVKEMKSPTTDVALNYISNPKLDVGDAVADRIDKDEKSWIGGLFGGDKKSADLAKYETAFSPEPAQSRPAVVISTPQSANQQNPSRQDISDIPIVQDDFGLMLVNSGKILGG